MRIFIIEKILFVEKPNDKKKVKPKISGEKNVSTKVVRVYRGLRYESIPFVLRQYHQFFKVKIHSGTDNFKTTLRQFQRDIYSQRQTKRVFLRESSKGLYGETPLKCSLSFFSLANLSARRG